MIDLCAWKERALKTRTGRTHRHNRRLENNPQLVLLLNVICDKDLYSPRDDLVYHVGGRWRRGGAGSGRASRECRRRSVRCADTDRGVSICRVKKHNQQIHTTHLYPSHLEPRPCFLALASSIISLFPYVASKINRDQDEEEAQEIPLNVRSQILDKAIDFAIKYYNEPFAPIEKVRVTLRRRYA
jgi:hypothetical protein